MRNPVLPIMTVLLLALPAAAQRTRTAEEAELRVRSALLAHQAAGVQHQAVLAEAVAAQHALLARHELAAHRAGDALHAYGLAHATQAMDRARSALSFPGIRVADALDDLLDDIAERGPAEPWAAQDPADSLYRAGREQLNRGNHAAAARLFNRIVIESRFRNSAYRPAAYYWQAFALARTGTSDDLRRARTLLDQLGQTYPRDGIAAEARSLRATIEARLAREGDESARLAVTRAARQGRTAGSGSSSTRARTSAQQQCEDDELRSVALNALLQMESVDALPILRELMERRDPCSTQLRRRAMMMIAQQPTAQAQEILINAALRDPDDEVREQATFWLSHVPGDAAVDALSRILAGSPSAGVREKAIFALGQHASPRASQILRDQALSADTPEDLRRHIVMSLAHSSNAENAAFLRQLFDRTTDREMKQHIVMSLASRSSSEYADWVVDVALDPAQHIDVRRHALMMAGHNPAVSTDRIIRLYDQTEDAEFRRHVAFVLGLRLPHDRAALDKLLDIARNTTDRDLQKQLILMLGHTDDPRVVEMLAEIVRRPVR